MPRHLVSDTREWINEIPSVPIYWSLPLGGEKCGLVVTSLRSKSSKSVVKSWKSIQELCTRGGC